MSKKVGIRWCWGGANNVGGASEVGRAARSSAHLVGMRGMQNLLSTPLSQFPSLCLVYRDGVIVAS